MKKYRQVSPERLKAWTEKSSEYCHDHRRDQLPPRPSRKVMVVYYLRRNRQLEHPHFMEVPLSSSDDLHLRDVMERLNVLRGRGIASMYSWSCKRSYKNGFVWHDLSDDDVVHPAHADDYILKGSEVFQEPNAGKALPGKTTKNNDVIDASTQTEEEATRVDENRRTCTRGVSTDDYLPEPCQNQVYEVKQSPEIRTGPLESLIRAEIRKLKGFQEDGVRIQSSTKIKVANVIMQLVSCGSVSVENRGLGLVQTNRPRFPVKFCSALCPTSFMLGEVDHWVDSTRLMGTRLGTRLKDKESCSQFGSKECPQRRRTNSRKFFPQR